MIHSRRLKRARKPCVSLVRDGKDTSITRKGFRVAGYQALNAWMRRRIGPMMWIRRRFPTQQTSEGAGLRILAAGRGRHEARAVKRTRAKRAKIFRPREQSPAGRLFCRTSDLRPGDCPSARAG
jgi:hypothetical protein